MLLQRVSDLGTLDGRSYTEKQHISLLILIQTAPFPFPLFLVFIPTFVASAATKPYLESKSRDSA